MSIEAADAFDDCPNRTSEIQNSGTGMAIRSMVVVTCPKYPEGTNFVEAGYFDNENNRGRAALRLGCVGCKYANAEVKEIEAQELLERLHPDIAEHCGALYAHEYYPEAAMKGFKIVKDRLREISGYEMATDAIGKGGLYIEGSAADHVDLNFQEAAKFVLMAIDRFRNEGSHTAYGNVSGSQRAFEYLTLSSLAMHLLDSGVTKE